MKTNNYIHFFLLLSFLVVDMVCLDVKAQIRQATAVLTQNGVLLKAGIVGNKRMVHYNIILTEDTTACILHTENKGFPYVYACVVDTNNAVRVIDISQPLKLSNIRWLYIFFGDINLDNELLNCNACQLGKDIMYNARLLVGGSMVSESDVRYVYNYMSFSCRTDYGIAPIIVEFSRKNR